MRTSQDTRAEELIKLVRELDEEATRAAREDLDEESLAIFDILKKPELSRVETRRVKGVALELLQTLKAGKLRADHWREKEATRDAVRVTIHDFLWNDETGLPAVTTPTLQPSPTKYTATCTAPTPLCLLPCTRPSHS